jgi:hypothetical protein
MNLEFNGLIGIGLFLTFLGALVVYFGKIILKSRKEITKDSLSETINAIIFMAQSIFLPILTIYVLYQIVVQLILPLLRGTFSYNPIIWFFLGTILVLVQGKIFNYYFEKIKTPTSRTNSTINFFIGIFIFSITFLFLIRKDWFFLGISLLFDFLIFTFMASRDPNRDDSNNLDGKLLKFIFLNNEKGEYKIKRLGDDFFDLEDKKGNLISINKSQIFSVSQETKIKQNKK